MLVRIFAVTLFSIKSMGQRKGASFSAIFGIAGVVAVLVGVFSIAAGFRKTMSQSVPDNTVIVLRSGADTEMMSGLGREETRIIADAPGIARNRDNQALASSELFVVINLNKRSTGTDANVPLRGIERQAFDVRGNFKIEEGRNIEWGRNEIIVGRGAAREFEGLNLGNDIQVSNTTWTVVGIFSDNGGIAESEIWTDAAVLAPAFHRGNTFQSVSLRLKDVQQFEEMKRALTTDPRLNVKVQRQADYYLEQSSMISGLITGLGIGVAILMGIGAVFAALNTMYTSVSARTREIATLRALGFRAGSVLCSIMLESLVLACIGGLIGGVLAWLAFDGFQAATLNWQSFSQVTFAFNVSTALLVKGIGYAILIGFVGGLFPAIRAIRMPVSTALREL